MSQTAHSISVIICAYTEKRWDDLLAAVESVRQQTVQPREIIIVIDYNAILLKQVQEHLVDVNAIENKQAKGASGSRNSGVSIAQGTVVAFLDDDAMAEPNWIEQLLVLYDDPDIVGVGGKIDPLWMGKRPAWFPDEFTWVVGCTFRGMPLANASVRNLIAANMSMRRDIFTAIGGFRESSGWNHQNRENNRENRGKTKERFSFRRVRRYEGGEEAELCIRIAKQYQNKVKFYYAPQALAKHHVPEQRTRWRYFLWRCYYEGMGKSFLVSLHGAKDGLAAERSYTIKALPQGILRGLTDAVFHRDLSGLARAGAIIAGLLLTIAGYLVGSIFSQIAALRNIGTIAVPRRRTSKTLRPSEVQQKAGEADLRKVVDHA